jgi:hypothetical protein
LKGTPPGLQIGRRFLFRTGDSGVDWRVEEAGDLLNVSSFSEQRVQCALFVAGSRTLHIRTRAGTNPGVVHEHAE